ncbi:MAG: hypothetical protein ACKOOI_17990, partial [Pirellula sp.]
GAAAATVKLHAVALRSVFRVRLQRQRLERDPTEFLGEPVKLDNHECQGHQDDCVRYEPLH